MKLCTTQQNYVQTSYIKPPKLDNKFGKYEHIFIYGLK